MAPATAPTPRAPSSRPYPSGPALSLWAATSGSSAQSEAPQKTKAQPRTIGAITSGAWRT